MPIRPGTNRFALSLYGDGAEGASGLYLPTANLTDPDTTGQITYAEGTGIVIKGQLVSRYTGVDGYVLDFSRNVAAASYPTARFVQDSTTGAQAALELQQDDTNVVPLKITDATGSCLIDGFASPTGSTAMADFGFAITIGTSDYIIPLIPH